MGRNTAPPPEAAKPTHDTAKSGDGKHYALVLDPRPDGDGNSTVPQTWHTVVGLEGYYFPGEATPVGGPGEVALSAAVAASQADGCGVSLVEVDEAKASKRRAAHEDFLRESRGSLVSDIKRARTGELDGGDVTRINDELAAHGQ